MHSLNQQQLILKILRGEIMAKVWWKSKTFWLNIFGAVGLVASSQFGIPWTPATTAGALAVLNFILRAVTHEQLTWTSEEAEITNLLERQLSKRKK